VTDLRQLKRIRWAVRAVLVLGIAASIAANVLHAEPNTVARMIAAWPPAALLLTLELIARVPVHRKRLAALRVVATTIIGGIAAWVSYWHMAAVALRYHEASDAAHLIPFSVDGLVVVASVSLVELAAKIRTAEIPPPMPAAEPVNPAPVERVIEQVTPEIEPVNPAPVEASAEPAERREIETPDPAIERASRRAAAVAALAGPNPDPTAIAAAAGVSVPTLHRWADETARAARRPRGGRTKPVTEGGSDGLGGPHQGTEGASAPRGEGVRANGRQQDLRRDDGEGQPDHRDGSQLSESGGRQGRHDPREVAIGAH
jgi:hypothetical protein